MPTGPNRSIRSDCKSEQIVRMRSWGLSFQAIAEKVGGTANNCRVLHHWRKTRCKSGYSATAPGLQPTPRGFRGRSLAAIDP